MMRISLRQLLVAVAVVALAIVSLCGANELWLAIVSGVAMVIVFGMLIVAVVDRGPRQVFAIGFVLTVIVYGAVIFTGRTTRGSGGSMNSANVEMDPYEGRLPTTRLLRYVFLSIEHGTYYDFNTGKELPNHDPSKNATGGSVGGGFGGGVPTVSYRENPQRDVFMPIGHCWWALLLGYAGGLFAEYVYARRASEQTSNQE